MYNSSPPQPYVLGDVIEQSQSSTVNITEEGVYLDVELDREIKREKLTTLQNNNRQRISYAKLTFILTCVWISAAMIIVVADGFQIITLSEAVIITLISTTTANVFGFFFLVIKYLFGTRE